MLRDEIVKELLFDFFARRLSPIQRKLLEEWIKQDHNEDIFYRYLDEWEGRSPQFVTDTEHSWKRTRAFFEAESWEPLKAPDKIGAYHRYPGFRVERKLAFPAAACILLLCCFLFRNQLWYKSYTAAPGKTQFLLLNDGTSVTLNSNSTLWVPRWGFGSRTREVTLEGEADFKVTHTSDHQRFIVRMGNDYQIEVLGTEFMALSRKQEKQVLLTKGRVKLKLPEDRQLYLKPGNLFSASASGSFNVSTPADPDKFFMWKEGMLYLDDLPIHEVATRLENRFGVEIRITDTLLSQKHIGGSFRAESIDDMLNILSDLLDIEIIQNKDFIELRTAKSVKQQ